MKRILLLSNELVTGRQCEGADQAGGGRWLWQWVLRVRNVPSHRMITSTGRRAEDAALGGLAGGVHSECGRRSCRRHQQLILQDGWAAQATCLEFLFRRERRVTQGRPAPLLAGSSL